MVNHLTVGRSDAGVNLPGEGPTRRGSSTSAAGGTVVRKGRRHTVSAPAVVPTDEIDPLLSAFWRRSTRPYGFESWLRVSTTGEGAVPAA